MKINNDQIRVISKGGNNHLGGEDFDQILCEHFIKKYLKKTNKNIRKNERAMQKLKMEVERAKRKLSDMHEVKLSIENFFDGEDF